MTLMQFIFETLFYGNILLFGYSIYVLFESRKRDKSGISIHYISDIYYSIGVAIITFFVLLSFLIFYIVAGLIWKFIWILILDSTALFWILLFKNSSVWYNDELLTFKNFLNSKRILKWGTFKSIFVHEITGVVILINDKGEKFIIMPYLNNYSSLINYIEDRIMINKIQ